MGMVVHQSMTFNCVDNLEDYVNVTVGRMFNPDRDDGVVEIVVSKEYMIRYKVTLNEVYRADSVFSGEEPVEFVIVGVIEAKDVNDLFWFTEFADFDGMTFSQQLFSKAH